MRQLPKLFWCKCYYGDKLQRCVEPIMSLADAAAEQSNHQWVEDIHGGEDADMVACVGPCGRASGSSSVRMSLCT